MKLQRAVLVGLAFLLACGDGGPAEPGVRTPTVTVIDALDGTQGVTGDEVVVIRGSGFGSDAGRVAVVFKRMASAGDTLPPSPTDPRGVVLSVRSTRVEARVPPASFGSTRVFVIVGDDVSNGTTVLVLPSVAGRYVVDVEIAVNPCDRPTVPDVAAELRSTPWDLTQTDAFVRVRIEMPGASAEFQNDLGADLRFFDSDAVSAFLEGDLSVTFTPGAFTGTMRLRSDDGDIDCAARLEVSGTRTG